MAILLHSLTLHLVMLDSGNLGDDELIFNPALSSLHTYLGGMDGFSHLVCVSRCFLIYLPHLNLPFYNVCRG